MPPKAIVPLAVFEWMQALLSMAPQSEAPGSSRRRTPASSSTPTATPAVAGPNTILGYGKKWPTAAYEQIEAADLPYLEWTLQHLTPKSSEEFKGFAQWILQKYRLGPTRRLEVLSSSSKKNYASSKTKVAPKISVRSPVNHEDQLDAALNVILEADPEEINSLAKRLVEHDQAYQETGHPSPKTLIGVQGLEAIYRKMLCLDEDEETFTEEDED